jgi:hypothetical protein
MSEPEQKKQTIESFFAKTAGATFSESTTASRAPSTPLGDGDADSVASSSVKLVGPGMDDMFAAFDSSGGGSTLGNEPDANGGGDGDDEVPCGQPEVAKPAEPPIQHEGDDLPARMKALAGNTIGQYLQEEIGGKPLTEENLAHLQAWFQKRGSTDHATEEAEPIFSGNDKKEHDRLNTAVGAGTIDVRSYLGVQFREYLEKNPAEKTSFAAIGSRKEQADFRLAWASKKLTDFRESRVTKKAWSRVDTSRGNYMNFARIVKEWGGWESQEAITGAITACNKCLAMGGKWMTRHPQSNLVMFLILDFGYTENFEQSWAHFSEEFSNGKIGDSAPTPPESKPEKKPEKNKPEKTPKDPKPDPKDPKQVPKQPTPVKLKVPVASMDGATLWREAAKLAGRFREASCTFVELDEKIKSDPTWTWAAGKSHQQLTAVQKTVKDTFSEWHKEFVMSSNLNILKKAHATAKAQTELVSFLTDCDAPISKLAAFCDSLQKAHTEMCKAYKV